MENKNEVLEAREEFFKLLPLIPVWLTLTGAIKIFTDYYVYNINIFLYLDLQEILTLFTNDLLLYIIASNAGILFYSFVNDDTIWVFNVEKLNISNLWKGVLHVIGAVIPVLLIGYATLMIVGDDLFLNYKKSSWIKWIHWIIYYIVFQLFISTCYRIFSYLRKVVNYPVFVIYRFYIFFLLFVTYFTFIQILNNLIVGKYDSNTGGYVTTDDRTINFDANHILVGKTKNYFFIHTPNDGCTEVIPTSTVKQIFIKGRQVL